MRVKKTRIDPNGKRTTTTTKLTPITKSEFNSGGAKYKKVATPLKKEAMKKSVTPRNSGSITKTITGANKFKNKIY